MKKLIIAMLAVLLASGAFAQQSFPDIPEGHWAGEAVDRIADLGIVIGFPDGTFRGNESFTRYQAALVVSRMLDVINENIDARFAMTDEDLASLRNAVQELASDVASQGTRLSSAESAIEGLTDDVGNNTARLDELEAQLADMDGEVDPAVLQDLQNQIDQQRVALDTAQATADEALSAAEAAQQAADAAQAAADEARSIAEQGLGTAEDALSAAEAAQQAADEARRAADEARAAGEDDRAAGQAAQDAADAARAAADEAQSAANAAQQAADEARAVGEEGLAAAQDAQAAADAARDAAEQAQSAADTAQSTAEQALDRANAAANLAEANAEEIAALNDLVQLLGNQLEDLEGAIGAIPGVPEGLEDRLSRAEGDIANIREFVILLRRDQVALRDRVSALEASDEQQAEDIADLQSRVTALEENPLGISGTIELEYFVGRHVGDGDFDVDRVYGLNNERDMGASTFSSGTEDVDDDDEIDEAGERAQDRADISEGSDFSADISLDIDASNLFGGAGSPRALNEFSAVVELGVRQVDLTDVDGEDFLGLVFSVEEFTTTFEVVGGPPISFSFGEEVTALFTPYTLNREDVGFVATIGAPEFLEFLDPTLQFAYSTEDFEGSVDDQRIVTGIRATVAPADFLTLGGSFVRDAVETGDKDDVLGDNVESTVFGIDATVALGPVSLVGEFAQASESDGGAVFVEADVDPEGIPIIRSFEANYRDIAGDWEASTPTDAEDYPYSQDQAGIGVEVGLGLFILDVTGYFDMYETGSPDAATTAFGVDASADLFAGFSLTAFFHSVSIEGPGVPNDGVQDDNSLTERDDEYDTGFGVGLVHDGTAENALIRNLNLEFEFGQLGADFNETHILAAADYQLSVSIVTLTPYVSFESFDDADANSDDTTEIKAGTGLVTEPLDVFMAPSLEAAVNFRQTEHVDVPGNADYTASEMQWSVGLTLNEFVWENSSLTARYGSYTGTNVSNDDLGGEGATDISAGDEPNGLTQSTSGWEVEWNYWDLMVAYGVYENDINGSSGSAQAFRVAYTVAF